MGASTSPQSNNVTKKVASYNALGAYHSATPGSGSFNGFIKAPSLTDKTRENEEQNAAIDALDDEFRPSVESRRYVTRCAVLRARG